MDITLYSLIEAIWIILPAYAANSFATLPRGHTRIDFGRKLRGTPLFGPGKTWEGLLFGVFIAMVIGMIQSLVFPYLPWDVSPVKLEIVPMNFLVGGLIGLGALLGDLAGAFAKRRAGLKRGHPVPLLDQLDFVVGSLLALSFVAQVQMEWVLFLLIITPAIHLTANTFAYLLKVKKEPY